MIEVDNITLGDVAERLNINPSTLRQWTDRLEDLNTHYVLRNNRNERIYTSSDIKIFAYLRDLKNEYGRKARTEDLAKIIMDVADDKGFELRSKKEAPTPEGTMRANELLAHEDIKRLMQSEKVRQFMEVVTKNIEEEIRNELTKEFSEMNNNIDKKLEAILKEREDEIKKSNQRIEDKLDERARQTDEFLRMLKDREEERSAKPWWKKIFD